MKITRELIQALYDSGPEAVFRFVKELVESMSEQIAELQERVKVLEDKVAKDSVLSANMRKT